MLQKSTRDHGHTHSSVRSGQSMTSSHTLDDGIMTSLLKHLKQEGLIGALKFSWDGGYLKKNTFIINLNRKLLDWLADSA